TSFSMPAVRAWSRDGLRVGRGDLNRRWGAVRAVRIRPSGARVHRNGGGSRGRGGGGGVGPAISRKIIWRAPGSYGQGLADQTSRHTGPKSNGTGRASLEPPPPVGRGRPEVSAAPVDARRPRNGRGDLDGGPRHPGGKIRNKPGIAGNVAFRGRGPGSPTA